MNATQTIDTQERPVTEKQIALLQALGFPGNAEDLSLEAAGSEIERLLEAAKERVKRLDLVSLAERRSELRKVAAAEWAGPCPKCGGDDRFHVTEKWFFCGRNGSGCHNKRGDAIEFVQWVENLPYTEAILHLDGKAAALTSAPARKRQAAPARAERPENWQKEAQALVEKAEVLLLTSGLSVQAELLRRGLNSSTCFAWRLGAVKRFHPALKEKQPAIVLPWLEADGETVQAVQFRFVGVTKEQGRFTQHKGGDRRLFGLHLLRKQPVLIVCEGELNALSIWQEVTGADVLSFGPEDNAKSEAALEALSGLAGDYQRVIVWADKPVVAKAVQQALPGAFGFRSPVENGEKVDANDWLQRGKLNWLLTGLLEKVTGSGQKPAELEPGVLGYYPTFAEGWAAYQAARAEGRYTGLSREGKGYGLFVLKEVDD